MGKYSFSSLRGNVEWEGCHIFFWVLFNLLLMLAKHVLMHCPFLFALGL
jgi:hypothetical protein